VDEDVGVFVGGEEVVEGLGDYFGHGFILAFLNSFYKTNNYSLS